LIGKLVRNSTRHICKVALSFQLLCVVLPVMFAAPAWAIAGAERSSPDDSGPCTTQNDIISAVQRQAADTATLKYLMAEVLRSLDEMKRGSEAARGSALSQPSPSNPSDQAGR
jgi:hypothetical protein